MRARRWGVLIAAVVVGAALWVPVGDAWAPNSPADPGGGADAPANVSFPAAEQTTVRTLQDPDIDELSGLAASRRFPGVLYGINDSGGAAVVFAIDPSGATVARLTLPRLDARDWEAIAPGWDSDGRPVLWIGDIGDNQSNQDRVRLVRISEPAELADQDVEWQDYWIRYSDGPHNAEALLVDPRDGTISVATKGQGGEGGLYRAAMPLRTTGDNTLERVGSVPTTITDGAWELTSTGEPRLVLIDYWRIHRLGRDGWISQLGPLQVQREALAWPWLEPGTSNNQVFLGSEGAGSQIILATVP